MQQSTSESNPYRMRPEALPLALISLGRLVKNFFVCLFYKFGNFLISKAILAFQDKSTTSAFRIAIISA